MTQPVPKAHFLEDLTVGMRASRDFPVSTGDIDAFAEVSHDHNPVHVDEAFAATTQFGGRIAHGMLLGAYISAVLASDLPGRGSIYVSQSLRFRRPVYPGDMVNITLTVTDIAAKTGLVTLNTVATVKGKKVMEGEAQVLPPRRGGDNA